MEDSYQKKRGREADLSLPFLQDLSQAGARDKNPVDNQIHQQQTFNHDTFKTGRWNGFLSRCDLLLNFTKKKWNKDFFPDQLPSNLMFDPFCRVVSRIKYKTDLFKFDLKAEYIPDLLKIKTRSLSWSDCCHERAEEIRKLNREHYLVSWSGGIDSTTMMIAIMNTWPSHDLKKIKILMSHSSVFENPGFYDLVISKFPIRSSMSDISSELLKSDTLLLTGELGDQLFGSDIMGPGVKAFGDEVLWRDYKDWAPKIIEKWTRVPGTGLAIFNHFEPIVHESPVPMKTVFDFFWWMNFSQKWQHVKFRFVEQDAWNLNAKYGKQILHFFDTPEFQIWSLHNHDLKIGKSWDYYKLAAKEYIVAFTKNQNDMFQKKIPSLALRNFLVEKRIAVTSDLKVISTDKELEPYVRNH